MANHLPLHHEAFPSPFIDQLVECSPWGEQKCALTCRFLLNKDLRYHILFSSIDTNPTNI